MACSPDLHGAATQRRPVSSVMPSWSAVALAVGSLIAPPLPTCRQENKQARQAPHRAFSRIAGARGRPAACRRRGMPGPRPWRVASPRRGGPACGGAACGAAARSAVRVSPVCAAHSACEAGRYRRMAVARRRHRQRLRWRRDRADRQPVAHPVDVVDQVGCARPRELLTQPGRRGRPPCACFPDSESPRRRAGAPIS
jgi:hypothetical protein